MKKSKNAPLLLAEDISLEPEHETRSRAVRLCAASLAQRLGASLDIVHVEDMSFYPVTSSFYKPLLQQFFSGQKAKLSQLAKSVEVPARAMFLNGDPVRKILSLASKRGAYEAIVLGTHGRKGLSRLILGSIAEEIIRGSTIPVVTVGPNAQKSDARYLDAPSGLKVLVATGLTPNSDRAEDYAVKLAKRLRAELTLFHSLRDSLHPVMQTALTSPGAIRQIGALLEQLETDAAKKTQS